VLAQARIQSLFSWMKAKSHFDTNKWALPWTGALRNSTPKFSSTRKTSYCKSPSRHRFNQCRCGSSQADDEVVGKSWFNTKAFPKATFVAHQIKPAGANQFDVSGVLTIKGKSQDIEFPLKLAVQGNVGVFTGGFVIRRGDFTIGEGIWAKFDVVANDIQVNFQLTANSGK
jgi:hypothetical protein